MLPTIKLLSQQELLSFPKKMLNQLRLGGLLVIPVGDEKFQKMVTILRVGENDFERIELDTFRFVPLVGDQAW